MSKKSKRVTWTRFIPGLQSLEARDVPAGNITAFLSGGMLIVNGSNDVDSFRVSGTGEGSVVIRPLNDCTLNGSSGGQYFGGFSHLAVQTLGGRDQVILENVELKNVTIDTGSDVDVIHLVGGTRIGNTTIRTGDGDDLVIIADARFTGQFSVDTGDGNDRLSIERSRFSGTTFLNGGGGGSDGFGITTTRFDGKFTSGFEAQFTTALPRGLDDTASVSGAGTAKINVLANDQAIQGTMDTTSVIVTKSPSFGTAVVNTDGTITYTRTADGNGSDTFQYVAKNSGGAFTNETFVRISLSGSIDTGAPTVTLTSGASDPTNTSPIPFTATFSENVSGFSSAGITVVNGTASAVTTVDAKTYTFTVTPTGQGNVSATIQANAAKDSAGNSNTAASATVTRGFDTVPPVVTANALTTNDSTPTLTGTVDDSNSTVTVTVNGQNATATVSSGTWTATLGTVLIDGTYTIAVSAEDKAGNTGTASNADGLVIDTVAPVATLTSSTSDPTTTNPVPFSVSFSENVSNFSLAGVTVTGGTAGGFTTVDARNYTFTVTASASGTVTVKVNADAASDAAGNKNAVTEDVSRVVNGVAPSVTLSTTVTSPTNATTIPVVANFSADVIDFAQGNLTLSNATASNFVAVNGNQYKFDLTPTNQGDFTVNIAANSATNNGVGNVASNTLSLVFDTIKPSGTIDSLFTNDTTPTITGTINDSTGKVSVTVNGQTVDGVVTGNTWAATLTTPLNPALYTITAIYSDAAGNQSPDQSPNGLLIETSSPLTQITSSETSPTSAASIPISVIFERGVTGFDESDVAVTNGTLTGFTILDEQNYAFSITPNSDGQVLVNIPAAAAKDFAGNDSAAAVQFTIVSERAAPTATITTTTTSPTSGNTFPVAVTFSETVTGFTQSSLSITNGSVSNFVAVDGSHYTFDVTANTDGNVDVGFAANAASDAAGNGNSAPTPLTVVVDTLPATPLITITSAASPTNLTPLSYMVTFGEPVSEFDGLASSFAVSGGTISNIVTVDTTHITFDITPTVQGDVTVSMLGGKSKDTAGNLSNASGPVTIVFDSVAATPVISTSAVSPTNAGTLSYTVTFDEPVNDFNGLADSFAVSGGSISNIVTVDSTHITFDITPTAQGDVTVSMLSGKSQDTAGNLSNASAPVTVVFDNVGPTGTIDGASISGTAADATTSVSKVEVSILSGGLYWDGTAFTSATEVFNDATGTTAWSYAFTTTGTYTVNARLTDVVNNMNMTTITNTVTIP
ncbi:hypothetical protein BH11PLA2_BH11PLA2_22140 [soil metagenome]